jgi:hypothetical protein
MPLIGRVCLWSYGSTSIKPSVAIGARANALQPGNHQQLIALVPGTRNKFF